jgi:hypothetical protein
MPTSLLARWFPLALLAVALTSGCGDNDILPFDPTTQAKLRVVHASLAPQGEADFLLDGGRITRLGYGQTTAYIDVAAGGRTIGMRDLPDQDGNPGPTYIEAPVTLTAGQFHTVVITGAGADVAALTTSDGATPAAGNWSLRIVHAGQGTPSLDLYVTPPGADLNAATPLVAGIDWREVTEYQVIATGTLQIRLTPTGAKTALISSNQIAFQEQQVSTLFVFDNSTQGNLPVGLLLGDGGDLE